MMSKKERAAAILTVLSIIFAAVICECLPIHGEAELRDKILRLHVIAASDSPRDQEIKLSVRDAVLDITGELLAETETLSEAVKAAETGRDSIIAAAKAKLRELGCEDDVRVELGREQYPTRDYGEIRLPAGEYTSLRVIIGDGDGQNWWCVLFPTLCMSAAKRSTDNVAVETNATPEDYLAAGFTPEQYRTITQTTATKYKIRFKLLEIFAARRQTR